MALQFHTQHALHRLSVTAQPVPQAVLLPPRAAAHTYAAPCASTSTSQCALQTPAFRGRRTAGARRSIVPARANLFDQIVYTEGYVEAEELSGIRMVVDENDTAQFEYLVKWKEGEELTWESAKNLSDDLIRVYEEKWWNAARKADLDTLIAMLAGGREILVNAIDENLRSALHFAAGLGNLDCAKLLVEAGADLNLQDKDGFTPLHMAAGYMHTAIITALVEAGADPEIRDNTGRNVVSLVDNLRNAMPLSLATIQRRLALEEVANTLTDRLYDEVEPARILDVRTLPQPPLPEGADPSTAPPPKREFLVAFDDGRDDEWIAEADMSTEVLEDWERGLEYATAEAVLDVVQVGTERRFKVQWSDGYPTSWEPEEHLPPELITLFQQQNPELFSQRTDPGVASAASGWSAEYETQYAPRVAAAAADASSSSSSTSSSPQHGQQQQQEGHSAAGNGNGSGNGSNGGHAVSASSSSGNGNGVQSMAAEGKQPVAV